MCAYDVICVFQVAPPTLGFEAPPPSSCLLFTILNGCFWLPLLFSQWILLFIFSMLINLQNFQILYILVYVGFLVLPSHILVFDMFHVSIAILFPLPCNCLGVAPRSSLILDIIGLGLSTMRFRRRRFRRYRRRIRRRVRRSKIPRNQLTPIYRAKINHAYDVSSAAIPPPPLTISRSLLMMLLMVTLLMLPPLTNSYVRKFGTLL